MHRHGYKGRKFRRETGPRKALMRGLAVALVEHSSIETTLPKAKELRPYAEKLITRAKKGSLHDRRQIISALDSIAAANKLVDEIAPKLSSRHSGYLRIERTTWRRGDNSQMARISFVDDLKAVKAEKPKAEEAPKKVAPAKKAAPKATTKKESK